MVQSQVIVERKDYVSICEKLGLLKEDLKMFRESGDTRCLDAMEQRFSIMENILLED